MDVRGFVVVVLLCSVCDGLNGIDRFFYISRLLLIFSCFVPFSSFFFLFFSFVRVSFFLTLYIYIYIYIHIHIHIYIYIIFWRVWHSFDTSFATSLLDKKAERRLKIAFVHPAPSVVHEYISHPFAVFTPGEKSSARFSRGLSRVSRDARLLTSA